MGLIPDIRFDSDFLPIKFLKPNIVKKEYIQNPEQYTKPRDFLINHYFSKPDYEAPPEKLYYIGILGAKVGTFVGIFEIMSKDISVWRDAMATFSKRFGFCTAAFLTYGAVASATANIRGKKDDYFNHIVGGASLGFLFGYLKKSSAIGSAAGVGCALTALAFKYFNQSGRYFLHPSGDLYHERNTMFGGTKYQDWRIGRPREEPVRRQHYLFPE